MSAIVVLEVNPNAIPRALLTILLLDKLKEAKSLLRIEIIILYIYIIFHYMVKI